MSTDCELIMNHIQSLKDNDVKIDIRMIKKAKKHLFMTKHKLFGSDEPVYFYPDYDIAQSWQRLTDKNRKLEAHDLLLIPHEALESDYMAKGYSQREAHNLANEKYDYQTALKTYNKEGRKRIK